MLYCYRLISQAEFWNPTILEKGSQQTNCSSSQDRQQKHLSAQAICHHILLITSLLLNPILYVKRLLSISHYISSVSPT
jgi:hypothetical protein